MRHFILGLVLIGLAGCHTNQEPLAPDFGDAVSHNIAVQTINPTPDPNLPDANTNGQRMTDALDRYRKGKPTPPISPMQGVVPTGTAVQTGPAP
jgi:hypothetical protein